MIKNIPNKYVKQDLLNDINSSGFFGYYDFFYLCPDLKVILKFLMSLLISIIEWVQ